MKQENTSARLFDGFSKWDVLNYVILGVLALLCLAPVINIVAISFSSASVAEAGLVSFWPRNPTFASYERILEDRIFFGTVIVSLLRVVIGTSLSLLLLFLMAYPLSLEKEEFSKRNWYMWFVIFTMLFNGGMIPTYLLVTKGADKLAAIRKRNFADFSTGFPQFCWFAAPFLCRVSGIFPQFFPQFSAPARADFGGMAQRKIKPM